MSKQTDSTNNPTGDISALNIPYTERNGLTLVALENAIECIHRIYEGAFLFLGFDGFILFPNGSIQPSLSSSMDCSNKQAKLQVVIDIINSCSSDITHSEFCFEAI